MLAVVANLALRLLFRSIEIEGLERLPRHRPLLIVANHFNGFVDPVLLVRGLHRMPRFLAKSTLWKVWPARPFLALAGIIPVHRSQDDPDTAGNVSTFRTCHEVLGRGAVVAIFPEGTTHDRPSLDEVRTGAARIALGAKAAGVDGLMIVPVGLVFDDKIALRSRAAVRVGEPIDLDHELRQFVPEDIPVSEDDRPAVRRLTDEIAARLRAVAPEYESAREHGVLSLAAEVALRREDARPGTRVPLVRREELAQTLAQRKPRARAEIEQVLGRYRLDLGLAQLRDDELVARLRPTRILARAVVVTIWALLVLPFALLGLLVNIVPYWIVVAAGRRVATPVTKGTVRLLTAIIVFPLAWVTWSFFAEWPSWGELVLSFVVAPVFGLVAVFTFEHVATVVRAWRSWQAVRERRWTLPSLEEDRAALVGLVRETADLPPAASGAEQAIALAGEPPRQRG